MLCQDIRNPTHALWMVATNARILCQPPKRGSPGGTASVATRFPPEIAVETMDWMEVI